MHLSNRENLLKEDIFLIFHELILYVNSFQDIVIKSTN